MTSPNPSRKPKMSIEVPSLVVTQMTPVTMKVPTYDELDDEPGMARNWAVDQSDKHALSVDEQSASDFFFNPNVSSTGALGVLELSPAATPRRRSSDAISDDVPASASVMGVPPPFALTTLHEASGGLPPHELISDAAEAPKDHLASPIVIRPRAASASGIHSWEAQPAAHSSSDLAASAAGGPASVSNHGASSSSSSSHPPKRRPKAVTTHTSIDRLDVDQPAFTGKRTLSLAEMLSDDNDYDSDEDEEVLGPAHDEPFTPGFKRPTKSSVFAFDARGMPSRIVTDDGSLRLEIQEGQSTVVAGSLRRLVGQLASSTSFNTDFVHDFLLTFRYFTTASELLDLLLERFEAESKTSATPADKNQVDVIRLRVVNVLKKWITNHWHDFSSNPEMLARLLQFLTGPLSSSSHAGYASQLTSAIGQNKQNDSVQKDTSAAGSFVPSLGAPSATLPTSVSPRSSFSFLRTVRNSTTMSPSPSLSVLTGPPPSFSFLDLNVKDIVEQLTLVELGRIKRITAHSLTGQAWNKSSRPAHAVPVLDVIERFNRVSFWVASEICACVNIKARVEILKRCIKIAAMCRDIKNFNTCLQFVAALNISAVQRLKQTWKQLSTKYASLWVELNRLMDTAKGYTNYRSHLASLTLPIVPYIGIHLNDLTLIEEGNPTFLEANGMPTTSTTSSPGSSAATTPSPQGPPSATLPASTASSSSAAPSLRKSSSRDRVEATSPRTPAEAHLTPLAAQAAVGLASSRGSLAFYKEPAGVTPIVNFKKMAMIAQVIRVVEWYQTSEYEFVAYPELQYWLVHGINVWDVNRLYKESLICEPRVSDLPSTAAGDLASGDGKPKRRNKFMSTRGTSPRDSTGSLTVSPSLSASNSASMVGAANNSAPVPSSSPSLASLLSSSSSDNKPKKRSIFGSRRASSSDESSSISAAQVALQLEGLGDSSSVSSMTGSVDQSAALEVRMAQLRLVQETTEAQLHDLQHANEILLRRVEELERTHVAAHTREVGLLARIEALEADAAQKTVKKPVQA